VVNNRYAATLAVGAYGDPGCPATGAAPMS
jgi:hypothetical protein